MNSVYKEVINRKKLKHPSLYRKGMENHEIIPDFMDNKILQDSTSSTNINNNNNFNNYYNN